MNNVLYGNYTTHPELKDYMIFDMHNHSRYSDGFHDIPTIIKHAKKLGIGLAVTDHNQCKGSLLASESMPIIPGMELTSKECMDLLVYFEKPREMKHFYAQYIQGKEIQKKGAYITLYQLKWSMAEILEFAREYNAFIALPHPDTFPPKKSIAYFQQHKHLLKYIDAVEGINAVMNSHANTTAITQSALWKKPLIGSSDAHLVQYLGSSVTACPAHDPVSFFAAIKKNKSIVIGNNLNIFQRIQTGCVAFSRGFRWNF